MRSGLNMRSGLDTASGGDMCSGLHTPSRAALADRHRCSPVGAGRALAGPDAEKVQRGGVAGSSAIDGSVPNRVQLQRQPQLRFGRHRRPVHLLAKHSTRLNAFLLTVPKVSNSISLTIFLAEILRTGLF